VPLIGPSLQSLDHHAVAPGVPRVGRGDTVLADNPINLARFLRGVNTAISQEITMTESGDKFTLIAVDAGGIQTMYLAASLTEALEKFEELRKAGLSQIFIKNGNRTVKKLR
jgi:hypothetical protein